jgi:hypothetical protein
MRNVGSTIINAERASIVAPVHAVKARNELLSFALFASPSAALLDTELPASFVMRASGALAYAAFRRTDGTSYLRVFDTSNNADYALSSASATSIAYNTMRHGLVNEAGTIRVYSADISGAGVQVKRATLTGTSNPVTVSWSNHGPAFGDMFVNTSTLVRRVEAVCPTDGGGVVVAVGVHDFTAALSTLQFYWLPDASTVIALNTLIQMPLTEAYAGNWYGNAKYCAFINAFYDTTSGRTVVIASDQTRGRAMMWSIQNGIESQVRPVIPLDPESANILLMPVSVSKLNGLYYLTARFSRTSSSEFVTAFDCYLTSSDGLNWSFGERNFFIAQSRFYGTLLMRSDSPTVVYCAGNNAGYSAPATKVQSSASTLETVLDDYLYEWSLDQVANGADKLTLTLLNPPVAGGNGALTNNANVRRGGTLYLQSGQGGTLADVGVYGIDDVSETINIDGRTTLKVTARDLGNKRMIDTNLPLEMPFETRVNTLKQLADLADLIIKTPQVDVKADGLAGWTYTGRNDPLIAYCEAGEGGDALMKATITPSGGDAYHLSSFGFVFGASDSGAGNVLLVPKQSSWAEGGAKDRPVLRRLNLNAVDPSDPKKADTGWNLSPHINSLWQSAVVNGARTAAINGPSPRLNNAWAMSPAQTYDLAGMISGRRALLFAKMRVTSTSTWAANAGYTLIADFVFDWQAKRAQFGRDWCGLATGQDVWVDIPSFAAAAYDDIEQTLTEVGNYAALADFGTQSMQCSTSADKVTLVCISTPSNFAVGQYVRLLIPSYGDARYRITAISSNNVTVTPTYGAGIPNGTTAYLYNLYPADEWGYANCGKKSYNEYGGKKIVIDPLATKTPRAIAGRAAFVSDDSTAIAMRFVASDGVTLRLRSGSEGAGGSRVGWDRQTNPIALADDAFYSSGSEPSVWRAVFHHGYVFAGTPTAKNLPATGMLDVEDECVRYAGFTFYRRGMQDQVTWTLIPTYYAPLAAASGPTSVIRNWLANGMSIVTGDDFGDIPNAAGLLVEISSRNGGVIRGDKQYYVASATKIASPTINSTSYISLDKAYENNVQDTDPVTFAGNGDIAIVSGRGQFGTKKTTHDADAPVRYSPRDAAGNLPSIKVASWDCFSGSYQSIEDVIRRMAALAGLRSPAFRNRFTTPASPVTTTLSTTPTALPIDGNLANFTLDARVHVPGNSTNAGGIINANALRISFRNYYQLWIGQYATAADYAAGRPGVIRVGLATTSTDISAAADGVRWLEWAAVPVTDWNVAGTVSGSNPNYTISEDVARLVDLRVAVRDNLITVEINGRPIWTFNLDRLTTGTVSFRKDTPSTISMDYALSVPAYIATIRVLDLGEELESYVAQRGSSVSSAISTVSQSRRLRTRTTPTGVVEFSRFIVRDDAGALNENLWQDQWTMTDLNQRGHYLVAGESTGEYADATIIAAEGYSFAASMNDDVLTAEDAANEAKLLMREAAEFNEVRGIDGVGLLEAQPEDKIALVYAGPGDTPQHPSSDHVVTQVQLRANGAECIGSYTLRRYVA